MRRMMDKKKKSKIWQPDPKISSMIKSPYDKGIPAYVAAKFLIRDKEGNIVKNPNVKTYFKYWEYWKEQHCKESAKESVKKFKKRQKEYERHYCTAYDKLILTINEMMQTLESCRKFRHGGLFGYENFDHTIPHIDIDLKLEMRIMRANKLCGEIKMEKFSPLWGDPLKLFNKNKLDKKLNQFTKKTHLLLLRTTVFLAKRKSKKMVLDCQINTPKTEDIVIKCRICAISI